MIKQLLNLAIAKYRDLSVARRSIVCLYIRHRQITDQLTTDKYILLDVLVYNIAVYFYEFCSIFTSPQGEPKHKELVKIYSDIVHQNIS